MYNLFLTLAIIDGCVIRCSAELMARNTTKQLFFSTVIPIKQGKMDIEAETPEKYNDKLPDDRKQVINQLRNVIKSNLPEGFVETISYGMITFAIPHSIYPNGYHCNPSQPLPFISIASQKNFVALYHMGIYADKRLLEWFTSEYPTYSKTKLDMGKSCIRFKKPSDIPFELIAELTKISAKDWINTYEKHLKKDDKKVK
jgi:hypothetical protein